MDDESDESFFSVLAEGLLNQPPPPPPPEIPVTAGVVGECLDSSYVQGSEGASDAW